VGRSEFRFATKALREGQLMRAFTGVIAGCCFALFCLGVIAQFHPTGPDSVATKVAQATILLSAVFVGFFWLLGPWPRYGHAVAFLVWADAALAVIAVTMSTPESRLSATLYMGLVGVYAGFLLGGHILAMHCGFSAAVIVGITGQAVLSGHTSVFEYFPFYMPALTWAVMAPLGAGLVLIAQGRRAIRRTARSAHYDPLTGLRNRRGMQAAVDSVLSRRQSPTTVTVAVCDVDRFKVLNDPEGHAAGDAALIEMAQRLTSIARRDEITARIGGDELVLVAFRDAPGEAAALLERLLPLTCGNLEGFEITASVGIAAMSSATPHFSIDDVVSHADSAMYEAKRAGGARCVSYRTIAQREVVCEGRRGTREDLHVRRGPIR
jgi:diguanylate cyclase (GGDEF)-like protein